MIDIGKNIKEIRIRRGLSQRELGKRLGVSAQAISLYEKNARRLTLTKIDEIAEALNCGRFDIFKSVIDPSNIKLNDELINNALESCKALASTATDAVIIAALLQLMSYRATGLAPDQVDEMKDELDYYKDEYNDIQARYDKLFHHMEDLGCQI